MKRFLLGLVSASVITGIIYGLILLISSEIIRGLIANVLLLILIIFCIGGLFDSICRLGDCTDDLIQTVKQKLKR